MAIRTVRKPIIAAIAGAIAISILAGCVKHKETITVSPDGAVHLKIEVEGDRQDMENGAPALARAPGWEFREHLVTEENGDEKISRQVEMTIPPGHPIPASYPTADPDSQALAVQHPTTLTIQRRQDGTYYHFRRIFKARPWAFVNFWLRDFHAQYGDKNPDEMTPEETLKFVEKLVEVERHKQLEIIRVASQSLAEPWSQDLRLAVHDAVTQVVRDVDVNSIAELLRKGEQDDEEVADAFDALAKRLDRQVADKVRLLIREAGLSERRIAAFETLLQRERRRFGITEDYQDESWEIELSMPGTLVGHNGDQVVDGRVHWEVAGERFFDREVELLATSMVPYDRSR
ncbi:MAG: hypothetical protein V3W34_01500 [Phycisphaerae bacterium]